MRIVFPNTAARIPIFLFRSYLSADGNSARSRQLTSSKGRGIRSRAGGIAIIISDGGSILQRVANNDF
jgi:hypothetical protein